MWSTRDIHITKRDHSTWSILIFIICIWINISERSVYKIIMSYLLPASLYFIHSVILCFFLWMHCNLRLKSAFFLVWYYSDSPLISILHNPYRLTRFNAHFFQLEPNLLSGPHVDNYKAFSRFIHLIIITIWSVHVYFWWMFIAFTVVGPCSRFIFSYTMLINIERNLCRDSK